MDRILGAKQFLRNREPMGTNRRSTWAFLISSLFLLGLGIESAQAQDKRHEIPFSLDHFRAKQIDPEDRSPSQPKELVAVVGTNRGRRGDWVRGLAFSPDGKRIASIGSCGRVPLFDTATMREVATIQVERDHEIYDDVQSLAFAPEGKTVALVVQGLIWLYDLTGQEPKFITTLQSTNLGEVGEAWCVFSPDGKVLLSSGRDGKIRLWDLSLPKPKVKSVLENRKGEPSTFIFLFFARDGKTIVSLDEHQTFIWWDLTGETPRESARASAKQGYEVDWVGVTPDGKTLLSANEGGDTVHSWRLQNNELKEIAKLKVATRAGECYIRAVALAPNGRDLALSVWSRHKAALEFWEFDGHQAKLRKVQEVSYSPYPLVFSPDGKVLAGGFGTTVQLFDPKAETLTPKVKNEGHIGGVRGVAFSADCNTLVTAGEDGTIRLWDLTGPKPKEVTLLKAHSTWVTSVAFSSDGKYLASTGSTDDKTVRLWKLSGIQPRESAVFEAPYDPFGKVTFSNDGKLLLAASTEAEKADGVEYGVPGVRVWDLKAEKPKELAILKGGAGTRGLVAISRDGKTVTNGTAIWDLGNGEKRPLDVNFRESELAFSPDGRTLAGCVGYKTLGLVDMTLAKPEVKRNLMAPRGQSQ
jgi:WD40 repeat protein